MNHQLSKSARVQCVIAHSSPVADTESVLPNFDGGRYFGPDDVGAVNWKHTADENLIEAHR